MDYLDKSRFYTQLGQRARLDELVGYKSYKGDNCKFKGGKASVVTTEGESDDCASMPQASLISPRSTDNTANTPHSSDHDRTFHVDRETDADVPQGRRSTSPPLSPQERKRKRVAEQHNKSEQRRRRKINSKLEELQAMVPFSRSREKAAILLDVIEYIKSVQAQLRIMSAITACDYASQQAAASRPDPFLSPVGLGPPPGLAGGACYPTTAISPGFPVSRGPLTMDTGMVQSGSFQSGAGFGFPGCAQSSGRTGGVGGEEAANPSGSAWSFSSGDSSAPFGAVVDNAASSYEPLLF